MLFVCGSGIIHTSWALGIRANGAPSAKGNGSSPPRDLFVRHSSQLIGEPGVSLREPFTVVGEGVEVHPFRDIRGGRYGRGGSRSRDNRAGNWARGGGGGLSRRGRGWVT